MPRHLDYIREERGRYFVSQRKVCADAHKNPEWFINHGGVDGSRKKFPEESEQYRLFFPLETVVNILKKSILTGDLLSFELLLKIKEEAEDLKIDIKIDTDKINIRYYFDEWVKQLEKPIEYKRDTARLQFNNYCQTRSGEDFKINRNYFSKIVNDALHNGKKIEKRPKNVGGSIIRLYRFTN